MAAENKVEKEDGHFHQLEDNTWPIDDILEGMPRDGSFKNLDSATAATIEYILDNSREVSKDIAFNIEFVEEFAQDLKNKGFPEKIATSIPVYMKSTFLTPVELEDKTHYTLDMEKVNGFVKDLQKWGYGISEIRVQKPVNTGSGNFIQIRVDGGSPLSPGEVVRRLVEVYKHLGEDYMPSVAWELKNEGNDLRQVYNITDEKTKRNLASLDSTVKCTTSFGISLFEDEKDALKIADRLRERMNNFYLK